MGEVYRAHDSRLARDVAVKILPADVNADPARRLRFEREARAAASLSHPNVVNLFDVGTSGEWTYAVMELLKGETLRDRLERGRIDTRRAIVTLTALARGLAAAHAAGLVHRDLKPANVFLLDDGQVKILDFGLAHDRASESGETRTALTDPGVVMGTAGYMAPEQVRGQAVDARTDIFALGVVAYETLSGRRPFEAPTAADTMSAVLNSVPPDLRDSLPEIPPTLADVVRRCLEKSPARRFQTATDLEFALEHSVGSSSLPAAVPAAPARTTRAMWLVGASVVTAAIAAGAYALGRVTRDAPVPNEAAFRALTIDSGEESWPSLSPDGVNFVYASQAGGNLDIYLRRLDGRNAINLTADSPAADTTPAFSPDGSHIAFRSERAGGGLFVMAATGEDVKRVSDQGFDPAWSPDGRFLAYATAPTRDPLSVVAVSELWVLNVGTGERRRLVDGNVRQPSWSPDGNRIAVWSAVTGGGKLLQTLAVAGGPPINVFDADPNLLYWNPVWAPDGWLYYSSSESGVMSIGRVKVSADGIAEAARESLTTPTPWAGQLALSRDGRRIAYQALSQRHSLWRVEIDPARGVAIAPPVALLEGALSMTDMSLSPDGGTVAFSSKGTAAPEDIYTIGSDGRGLRQLTNDLARDRGTNWLLDGSRLLFYSVRPGGVGPWSMNPDGSDLRFIGPKDDEFWQFPRPTPDGHIIVTASLNAILDTTVTPARIVERMPRMSPGSGGGVFPVAWSPDGSMLAARDSARSTMDTVLYHPSTKTYERLSGVGIPRAWLRDPSRILTDLNHELAVVDPVTHRRVPWSIDSGAWQQQFCLSPDGRTIFYVTVTRDADIWLMTLGSK